MNKYRLKGKPNRGATLLIVLIAMAMVGIMATMVLTMAMSNLQMKNVDKSAKKNFYSAEVALDEIRAGLEEDIAKEIESTYVEIMLEYASLPVGDRSEKFKDSLSLKLSKKFDTLNIVDDNNYTNITTKYNLDDFKKYLVKTKAETTISAKNGMNNLECRYVKNDSNNQYICFRNICLGYVERGTQIYTQITTDIKVAIPNAHFDSIGIRPAYMDYSVIANQQLWVDNGESGYLEGNVYAGQDGILTSAGGTLSFKSNQLVVKGNIATKEGGTIKIDDMDLSDNVPNSIWVNNILTSSASSVSSNASILDIKGDMYVADDVTINAPNSTVKLSGSYYGYSFENNPQGSSAMIVNRRNSMLDLSDIHNIFIAGRAYIEPAKTTLNNEDETSEYVLTGEAISTKSNQMAYLLPGDCIGVRSDGTSVGHNPLSMAEYQKLMDDLEVDSSILQVDSNYELSYNGKKLSDYVDAKEPFILIMNDTETTPLVYYYPNFKSEVEANRYFKDFISNQANKDTILQRLADNESYIKLPNTIVNNSTSGRKTFAGNIVAYTGGTTPDIVMRGNSVAAELPNQFKRESEDLKTMYDAYLQKLVPSVTLYNESELDYDIFKSLIVQDSTDANCPGILQLIDGKTMGANNSYLFDDTSYGEYGKFMLVNNTKADTDTTYNSSNAFKVKNIDPDVHIIIATGDVEVQSDFNGIIISKGIVKITNGAKVTASPKQVFDLICNSPVRTVFKDYSKFPIYSANDEEKQIDVGSLITEENWSKN